MNFDYKIIEEKMKQLPEEIQVALTSTEFSQSIKGITDRYSLKIDQEEILYDLVAYALLGLSPSKDFVKNFSNETGVDETKATQIAQDINKEVFGKIKSSMQTFQAKQMVSENASSSPDQQLVSSLEQAGNFTVEPAPNTLEHGEDHLEDRAEVIKNIENPVPAVARITSNTTNTAKTETHTDLLVDHLLSSPTVTIEQKIEQKKPVTPPTPVQVAKKPSGPDLYREAVE